RRRARGLAQGVSDRRPRAGPGQGQGPGRLSRGPRAAPRGARMSAPRADALTAAVAERELDALLVPTGSNLRWLTGFTGTNGVALIGADLRAFITDFRYVEQADAEVNGGFDRRRGERDLLEDVRDALPDRRPLRLGFDDANTSVRTHGRLRELLGE